jgi:arylsulfatase A-like enzyme
VHGALRRIQESLERSAFEIAAAASARDYPGAPNIVLIVADGLAWGDLGFMGSTRVQTPNLDRLAREGVVFTHTFNTANSCRPSLSTLASGLHPLELRRRVERSRRNPLPGSELPRDLETLPALLAERGYASFQGGQWYEGSFAAGGFTHGAARGPSAPDATPAGGAGLALAHETLQPLWEFLEEQQDQRFFVWFAPMLPETPFDAAAGYAARDRDAGPAAPYYAGVTRFDARVGELLERLDALGLREKTLVVFLAANGWAAPSPGAPLAAPGDGPRGEGSLHELGFRTPLVFHWPGALAGGRSDARIVSSVDLFPTLLELAGARVPRDRSGLSLAPLLRNAGGFARRDAVGGVLSLGSDAGDPEVRVPRRSAGAWFLRTPRWRYVWQRERGEEALYRIEQDPLELRDVRAEHPEVAARLRLRLEAWLEGAR